jgi:hypothetical protein
MAMSTAQDDIGGSGYTLDDLSDYLDAGRSPANPQIDNNAECQAVLASLDRLTSLSHELVTRDAAAAPSLDEGWIGSLMATIGREVRAGRDIPIGSSDPSTTLSVTEGALRELVRAAGDSVDGVLVGSSELTGDLSQPGAPITVAVSVSVVLNAPVVDLAQAVRERVHSELLKHTELAIEAIDVTVSDVHFLPARNEDKS